MSVHPPKIIAAVRRMKGEGVRNSEIGMAVGLTESSIEALCHQRGIRRPTAGRLELPLGAKLTESFRAEAVKRGMRYEAFMRKLLLTIERDNLFTAILDDGK